MPASSTQNALLNLKKYWMPSPPPVAMSKRKNTACAAFEAEADAVGVLEIGEVQVRGLRRDLAPVREERHVERRERLPAVLGVHPQRVRVAEPVVGTLRSVRLPPSVGCM